VEHLHHFQLAEDPFRNEPLVRLYVESAPHREALLRLERAVRQTKGLCVLGGEVGSGKTMVLRRLLESLEEEVFEANMMVILNGAADADWILGRFAAQLGLEEPAPDRESLLSQVYERLAIIREDGRHAVMIVDDAQALASPETLVEVCGLLKLEYEDRRLLTLVLAGGSALERALAAHPELAHRVDVKVRVGPLDAAGCRAFLEQRIRAAQGDPGILEPDAMAALHRLGQGLPGRVNTLADNALFEAFLCGRDAISRVDVERAHRDLGWGELGSPAMLSAGDPAPFASPGDLDSELEGAVESARAPAASNGSGRSHRRGEAVRVEVGPARGAHSEGPAKDADDEVDDLLVELLDE
jgi:general secretion pathway protein A